MGEGNGVPHTLLVIAQMTTHIIASCACLAHQHPSVISHMEQAGEGVSLSILRGRIHGGIGLVLFLIGWFGTLPSVHRLGLGANEGGGVLREVEGAGFRIHDGTAGSIVLSAMQGVAECHIMIGDSEGDRERPSLCILHGNLGLIGHIMDLRGLDARHHILVVYETLSVPLDGDARGEISRAGLQSQARSWHHGLAVIGNRVGGHTTVVGNRHLQLAVG